MYHINARNVNDALILGVQALNQVGVLVETRNGKALEFPTPVCTTYSHPRERVLFEPKRNANPFFHLMESLWMLSGRNDTKWLEPFNSNMSSYSDDGMVFKGAYGHRWRNHFGYDQLEIAIKRLSEYKNDRRTVISMWDPKQDLVETNDQKDIPCNTQIYLNVRDEDLHMTVVNRSNDMIWGAYGANVVHMSILQEYIAASLECGVGKYHQFSNNLHAYLDTLEKVKNLDYTNNDPYLTLDDDGSSYVSPALVDDPEAFLSDLDDFIENSTEGFSYNLFFSQTAIPMRAAWSLYKCNEIDAAVRKVKTIKDKAWQKACLDWLTRIIIKREQKHGF